MKIYLDVQQAADRYKGHNPSPDPTPRDQSPRGQSYQRPEVKPGATTTRKPRLPFLPLGPSLWR